MKKRGLLVSLFVVALLAFGALLPGCTQKASNSSAGVSASASAGASTKNGSGNSVSEQTSTEEAPTSKQGSSEIAEGGTYTSKDEVAYYLHTYGHLPSNYVTKDEAEDAGWKTGGKSLAEACPGKSIGGDRFGNREGKLPKAKGRTWYECDIDYNGERSRNAKRILYSNDGLIYYTEDHYKTFEQLY